MTIDDMATLFRDTGAALARIPALDAAVASLHAANEQAEVRITDLLRTLADTRSQLDAATAQLDALTAKRGTFEIDPAFDSERSLWYGKLREAIAAQRASILATAATGSPEAVGFAVKDYVLALAWAIGGKPDPLLLAEMVDVFNALCRRTAPGTPTAKDAAFLASLYALAAYLLHVNRHPDAAEWLDRARAACANGIPQDDLMHPYAASAETAAYLWLTTGEARWKDDLDLRVEELRRSIGFEADGRATWWHRPSFARGKPGDTPHPAVTYARYVIQSLAMLSRLGVDVVPMRALADTVRFLTSPPPPLCLYYWMDGGAYPDMRGAIQQHDPAKFASSNFAFVIGADASGELARRFAANASKTFIHVPAAFVGKANT